MKYAYSLIPPNVVPSYTRWSFHLSKVYISLAPGSKQIIHCIHTITVQGVV